MSAALEDRKNYLIQRVLERLEAKLTEAQLERAEPFVRQYYRGVGPGDLVERSVLDLYGAALAHWHLAQGNRRANVSSGFYNPRFDQHGWECVHTIIEIVHDDIRFSWSMLVNRFGSTVHLIVHPVCWRGSG